MSYTVDVVPYRVYLKLNIELVQCHIHKCCDIMESVGVRHRYNASDGTKVVNRLLYTIQWI